jgi:predicted acyltransferase
MPALLRHSPWHGLTVADLVFPLFLLSMGVAMPMSARASTPRAVARRVVLLALLGLALSALKTREVALVMGVLQHIAGAYLLAWLVLRLPRRAQVAAVGVLLGGAWLAFEAVGSWAADRNAAALLDRALLGGASPEGVMVTLVSTANVVAGAWVGLGLRAARNGGEIRRLLLSWAVGGGLAGLALAAAMPVNKRIWTPAYAVLTHGICCALLLVMHVVVDRPRRARVTGPFVVLGRNPIAVYVAVTAAALTVVRWWRPAVVHALAGRLAPAAASLAFALLMAGAGLLLAAALWRRRVFIRV